MVPYRLPCNAECHPRFVVLVALVRVQHSTCMAPRHTMNSGLGSNKHPVVPVDHMFCNALSNGRRV
eukprot:1225160-Amphidinium_carterae.1